MEIKDILNDARKRMDSAVEDARKKLATVRTGRASVSLLDSVTVEYYGTEMPLNQVATMHVPESTLVTVQPFDPTQLANIEKRFEHRSWVSTLQMTASSFAFRFLRSPRSGESRW